MFEKVNLKEIDVMILCGGQGTRFRKVRKDVPKALAPINGITFIDLLIASMQEQGLIHFILCVGYLRSQIIQHFKSRKDVNVVFSEEITPLGTGGAVKNALQYVNSDNYIVANGDSMIKIEYQKFCDFHYNHNKQISMVLTSSTQGGEYGAVRLDRVGNIISFNEKGDVKGSSYVNAGIYLINKSVLKYNDLKKKESLENDIFPVMAQASLIKGFANNNYVYDIGTLERYQNIVNNNLINT
jgi:D-glycero-alpha-D-manno-heptose 1-phosphate guanylyltransferase